MEEQVLQTIIENTSTILKIPAEKLNADTAFEELGIKSVNFVQIIAALEEKYEIEIPFMKFRRNKTLGEAAAFVASL